MTNDVDLEPNAQAYGRHAARSALADFIELSAVSGVPVDRSHLAAYLNDAPWQIPADELFVEPIVDMVDDEDVSLDVADSVFELIHQRMDILRERYPFHVDARGRVSFIGNEDRRDPYLALLATTVAHAYQMSTPRAPHDVFPESMTAVMQSRGMTFVCFSSLRKEMSFRDAVQQAGEQLLLMPTPDHGLRSRRVQDAGGDVVGAVGWADSRPGAWTFIGQATVGLSETWRQKAMEPSANWSVFLNTTVRPVPFLGVPHHVEPRHLAWLVEDTQSVVVDRLRLVLFKEELLPDEEAICDVVFTTPVANLVR